MSGHQHVSDDVFIDALYGLAAVEGRAAIDACVRECPACAARWNALQEARTAILAPVAVGSDVLAAQRANIYRRIEHPSVWERLSGWTGPLVAGATAACLLAVGVMVHDSAVPVRPVSPDEAVVSTAAISDTQLYSDVYAMEQSFEPSTASSMRVLFERDGSTTDTQGAEHSSEK